MKLPTLLRASCGVDPIHVAGTFGALAGVGSLLEPYLIGLSEALAAIGVVAFVSRGGPRIDRGRWRGWVVAAGVAVAEVVSFLDVPPWSAVRGVFLGLGAAGLAVTAGPPPPTTEVAA